MSSRKFKSIVRTTENPPIYVPQQLQSPLILKRFWYISIFEFTAKALHWLNTPFRMLHQKLKKDAAKVVTGTNPRLEVDGKEINIDAPEGVEVKLEIVPEASDE